MVSQIKIKTISEYKQELAARKNGPNRFLKKMTFFQSTDIEMSLLTNTKPPRSSTSLNKISDNPKISIAVSDSVDNDNSNNELKIDMKEAMLLIVPLKMNSKKNWVFIFSDLEMLRLTLYFNFLIKFVSKLYFKNVKRLVKCHKQMGPATQD